MFYLILFLLSGTAKIAFLHHGNQSFSDNGAYALRPGDYGYNGNSYHRIMDTHEYYSVPVDIHISGPLLQSFAYLGNDNGLLERLKGDLVDIVGGFYAEHIAPYVPEDMNRFSLWYERIIDSSLVKEPGWPGYPTVIWIPERVWKSEILMPYSLIDVLNQEYGKYDSNGNYIAPCIVLDDAAQWINSLSIDTRKVYKLNDSDGDYVFLVFIDTDARNNMVWNDISDPSNPLHQELIGLSNDSDQWKVLIYGDDWEKAAGVAGWDFGQAGAPSNSYDHNISWIKSQSTWIQPVHICEIAKWWGSDVVNGYTQGTLPELDYTQLVYSTYPELHDWTGGTYDNWYNDFKSTQAYGCSGAPDLNGNGTYGDYEDLYMFGRQELIGTSDNNVSKLGWVVLMGMLYETGWHTGPGGELVYWGKNLWNHSRYAGGFAYASDWLSYCDTISSPVVDSVDLDGDGEYEYLLYNNKIFFAFEKRGGRALWVVIGDSAVVSGNLYSNWGGEGDFDDGGHWGLFHDTQAWNSIFKVASSTGTDYAELIFQEVYDANGDSSWDLRKSFLLKEDKNYLVCEYNSGFTNWTKSMVVPDAWDVLLRGHPVEFIWGVSDSGWMYGGYRDTFTDVKAVYLWGSGEGLTYNEFGSSSSGAEMMEIGGLYGNYRFYFYAGKGSPEVDTSGPGDLEGPIIYSTGFSPEKSILPDDSVVVETHVVDPSGISTVYIHLGINGGWGDSLMTRDSTDSTLYRYTIPPQAYGTLVEFDIHAYDGLGHDRWDNNNGENYSYRVGVVQFEMDGILDRVAILLAENPDMHLWYYFYEDSMKLYLATEAAGDDPNDYFRNDHFIFVSASPDTMVPAPWSKTGLVGRYDYFLADENDNDYSAWYDSAQDTMPMPHATGEVLEGVLDLKSLFDTIPETLWIAVGTYETWDGGTLQWQIPMPGVNDGDIQSDEFTPISLTGIEEERGEYGNIIVDKVLRVFIGLNNSRWDIFDCLGRRVMHGEFQTSGKKEIRLSLPSGVYFFMLNNRIEKKLVVIQ